MKHLILTLMILVFSGQICNSQIIEPDPNSTPTEFYEYHQAKFKQNRNTARILGITGGVLAVSGIVYIASESTGLFFEALVEGEAEGSAVGGILTVSGLGLMTAAIPLAFSARQHKNKAKLYLTTSQNPVSIQKIKTSRNIGISVVIPLN